MNLRTARQKRKLTLTQAGEALGLDAGNLSRIERNLQVPRLEMALTIARFYRVSLDVVYGVEPARRAKKSRVA